MVPAVLKAPTVWDSDRFFSEGPERTELIEGELVPMSGVNEFQDSIRWFLETYLSFFCAQSGFGQARGENFEMRIDAENTFQPDVHVYAAHRQGQLGFRQAQTPADLVVEVVSPSARDRDWGAKFEAYQRAGVTEYWIVDPLRDLIACYTLTEGAYRRFEPEDGVLHSHALPGLRLPASWLLSPPDLREGLTYLERA